MKGKLAAMVVGGTAVLGLALSTSPASAASWHYQWFDTHTPTTSWSTKNVGLGPGGRTVRFDVWCSGGGTYKVGIRKAGFGGADVATTGDVPCNSRWYTVSYTVKNERDTRWAYYAHLGTHNGKRPLQVAGYWR
ncbi:hypothetical protein ACIRYZ_44345 [Kitasatospora sp. NPDC101155]|uniref:hypothetical protein n=1 Tax=Kitasatospora sp. NPDC101155 TaxID=3364097 RepID=UPI00380EBFD7